MDILIAFATKEGQTEKIANFIAEIARHHNHQATALLCEHLPNDFHTTPFDAAIIGGSIHMGKYESYLNKFVTTHLDWLNQVPSAFFTVCLAIQGKNEKAQIEAKSYGSRFCRETHWQPNLIETFAGTDKYTQYGFITRKIMQHIAKKEGRSTDTTTDHEYTDWEKVTQFTEKFISDAEMRIKEVG